MMNELKIRRILFATDFLENSRLAMAGASIKEIQELAGHKTITMSARYSHLSPEHRLSVIDKISSTLA
jgi:site-specific recombinase XerD